jgi:heme exporter protein D
VSDLAPVLAVILGTVLALVGALAAIGWQRAALVGREADRRRRQQRVTVALVEPVAPTGTLVSRR